MTLGLGTPTVVVSVEIAVTGLSVGAEVGAPTITGTASVAVTGQEMTSAVGAPAATTWTELTTNADQTWAVLYPGRKPD